MQAEDNKGRLDVLDGLRGLAVLLVVLFHIWQISWFDPNFGLASGIDWNFLPAMGFFGVDLFFFLSAFCLTLPFARHWFADAPPPEWQHYTIRRIVKIVPSYWLLLLVLLIFLPDPSIPKERLWFQIGTHLLFIHNWFLETSGSIAGILWSLAIEVQFYIVFPLLLLLLRRAPFFLLVVMIGEAMLWRTKSLEGFHRDTSELLLNWHDSQLPARLDIFAVGMVAAYLLVRLQRLPGIERWKPLFSCLSGGALLGVFWVMQRCFTENRLSGSVTVGWIQYRLPLSFLLLILGVCLPISVSFIQKVVANRVLVFLSLISYNLYLWHQVIARWMLAHHIPSSSLPDPHSDSYWKWLFTALALVLAMLFSTLITWLWERPFLQGRLPWNRSTHV